MDPRIVRTIEQMERRMAEPLSAATLAREVNLSPSRFCHLFVRDVGIPPMRHLQALRLVRARLLLERTFLSVRQVRGLVGIEDPGHFARDFQRAFGISPADARPCSRIVGSR